MHSSFLPDLMRFPMIFCSNQRQISVPLHCSAIIFHCISETQFPLVSFPFPYHSAHGAQCAICRRSSSSTELASIADAPVPAPLAPPSPLATAAGSGQDAIWHLPLDSLSRRHCAQTIPIRIGPLSVSPLATSLLAFFAFVNELAGQRKASGFCQGDQHAT